VHSNKTGEAKPRRDRKLLLSKQCCEHLWDTESWASRIAVKFVDQWQRRVISAGSAMTA
jgi:hypothetical protein